MFKVFISKKAYARRIRTSNGTSGFGMSVLHVNITKNPRNQKRRQIPLIKNGKLRALRFMRKFGPFTVPDPLGENYDKKSMRLYGYKAKLTRNHS